MNPWPLVIMSLAIINYLLGSIWESREFYSVHFSFVQLLIFYLNWISVGWFCSWIILELFWLFYSSIVAALSTLFSYFSIGLSVQVFRLNCRNISNIAWDIGLLNICLLRALRLIFLSIWNVTHITCNRIFFAPCVHFFVSFINRKFINSMI